MEQKDRDGKGLKFEESVKVFWSNLGWPKVFGVQLENFLSKIDIKNWQ